MASLTNTKIKNTYVSLLKVADNGQLDAALQDITDGAGNVTGVQLNTGGDLAASGTVSFGSLKDTGENITISKFVDAADGIGSNNNDTTIPTSAAVKLYVDTNITAQDLDFTTDSGTGAVDLDSQTFSILGTANEIETSGTGQTVTIGLPSTITANVNGNVTGDLTGTVLTAAQTNITSVGTLSSLAVSGNLTVDTDTLFVDAANNRVGILTSSPDATLHLKGDNSVSNLVLKFEDTRANTPPGHLYGQIQFYGSDATSPGPGIKAAIRANSPGTNGEGYLTFSTSDTSANDQERMRIDEDGYLRLATAGIQFNGDTADANALDDYEEGNFTPEVADAETGGNVAAGGSYAGKYTKIGRQVTVNIQASNINTTGMTAGNDLWIRNLPFTAGSFTGTPIFIGATRVSAITAAANSLGFSSGLEEGASAIRVFEMIDALNSAPILVSSISSGASDIWINLTYFV
jgi:hypothetical protein